MQAFIISFFLATAMAHPRVLQARDAACMTNQAAACCNEASGSCSFLDLLGKCQDDPVYCCDTSKNVSDIFSTAFFSLLDSNLSGYSERSRAQHLELLRRQCLNGLQFDIQTCNATISNGFEFGVAGQKGYHVKRGLGTLIFNRRLSSESYIIFCKMICITKMLNPNQNLSVYSP
jgi:hypothetical protein